MAYADNNYDRAKQLYDVLAQAMEDMKYGVSSSGVSTGIHGGTSWNKPINELEGVTMRLIGEGHLELTYHHYEITTVEGLALHADKGVKFLEEIVKDLKKRFKIYTKKALKCTEIKDSADRNLEQTSRLQSDTSWQLGASRYGHGSRPVGRYLIRDSAVYEISANL